MGLKILIIGGYPLEPGSVDGGVESANSVLVPALAERDDIDSVAVLRFHHGEASTNYRRESSKVEIHYVRGQYRWRMITGAVLDRWKARRLVATLNPDVVHGQEIGMDSYVAARCGPNCVVTVHGITYVEEVVYHQHSLRNRLRAGLLHFVAQRVLRRAKVVISISKYDAEELSGLVRHTRVSIANPIAAEFFALAPSAPTEPRLVFAGALIPLKNPLGIVNAFAKVRAAVPDARLALIGPHPDAGYLQAIRHQVSELDLTESVDITGAVDTDRIRREIAAARAVVSFSLQENAPTIIAQAMAAGKPVIASAVGGVPEMVADGETGFLVESGDEATLADRMVAVLDDQHLCLKMGGRAHEIAAARFERGAVAAKTMQAYRTALMGGHS